MAWPEQFSHNPIYNLNTTNISAEIWLDIVLHTQPTSPHTQTQHHIKISWTESISTATATVKTTDVKGCPKFWKQNLDTEILLSMIMVDVLMHTKEGFEDINNFQCYHNNLGYCRFREKCRYQHYFDVCSKSICRDKRCPYIYIV